MLAKILGGFGAGMLSIFWVGPHAAVVVGAVAVVALYVAFDKLKPVRR